jgi:Sap, sulfolipid-1-addressing protein
MMSTAVGDTLPLAVAVAVSPLLVIAVILILLSQRARSNGLAFLLGWIVGLTIAEGIVLVIVIVSLLSLSPGSGPVTLVSVLKLLLGGLLLYFGITQWRKRLRSGQEPSLPRWMASIDSFTPATAFGLAALLSTAGNLALILAAGLVIGRAKLGIGQEVGAVAIFIVIGSLTVAVAVIYHLVARAKASKTLDSWKAWLVANNATLISALFVVVGALLVGKGISGPGLLG